MKIYILLCLLFLTSCHGDDPGDGTPNDSNAYAVEASMHTMNSSMNDTEAAENYAVVPNKKIIDLLIPKAYAYACEFDRFTPTVSGASTCVGTENDATVTENFDGCNAGNSARVYREGQIKLAFSSPATCDTWVQGNLPTSGGLVLTTTNYASHLGANRFRITSESRVNYLGETLGGGVSVSYGVSSRQVDINGVHYIGDRVLNTKTVNFLDYTVSTPTALTVSGRKVDGNRQITAGTIKVDNNRRRYTMTATVSDLQWTAGCCYPTAGTLTFTRTGSLTSNLKVIFNPSCNEVDFEEGDAIGRLSLSQCD